MRNVSGKGCSALPRGFRVAGLLLLLLVQCSRSPDRYFHHVSLNDDLTFRFEQPLLQYTNVANIDHYEITYDAGGRVSEIARVDAAQSSDLEFFFGTPTVRVEYTDGFEKREYLDSQGLPTTHNGFYSIRIKRENNPRTVTWFGYNRCGKLMENQSGVCQLSRTINDKGFTLEDRRYDKFGAPVTDSQGVFLLRYRYSDRGLLEEISNYDSSGLLLDRASGYSTIKYKYDKDGKEIEEAYFDSWGMLAAGKGCYAVIRTAYDDRGNRIEESYHGEDSSLVLCATVAIERWAWDKNDSLTGFWHFDRDTNLTTATIHKRDNLGRKIETRYVGADSQLTVSGWDGTAVTKYQYDAEGNVSRECYFGRDEQPVLNHAGVSAVSFEYDGQGRLTERKAIGLNGDPVEDTSGIAITRYTYWQDSLKYVKKKCYGANDQLKSIPTFRVAILQFAYDTLGNLVEDRYFGPDEQPAVRSDRGAAIVRFKYDDKRHIIEQSYLDASERLINRVDLGYAIVRYKYNDCGYTSEVCYYDARRRLVPDSLGNAMYKYTYDDVGNITRREYYDNQASLREDSAGFAAYESDFDGQGRRVRYATFGGDGNLKGNNLGIAVFQTAYVNAWGRWTTSWLDDDNQPLSFGHVFSITTTVDSSGNTVKIENRNKKGRLVSDSTSVAVYEYKYDKSGNQIEANFFSPNLRPVVNKYGYTGERRAFDDERRIVSLQFVDALGRLQEHNIFHCAMIKYTYNDGVHVKTSIYDRDGNKISDWKP